MTRVPAVRYILLCIPFLGGNNHSCVSLLMHLVSKQGFPTSLAWTCGYFPCICVIRLPPSLHPKLRQRLSLRPSLDKRPQKYVLTPPLKQTGGPLMQQRRKLAPYRELDHRNKSNVSTFFCILSTQKVTFIHIRVRWRLHSGTVL